MKTLKNLTLFTALVILSACSASGNDGKNNGGNGGGTGSIKQQLQGTWVDKNSVGYVGDIAFTGDTVKFLADDKITGTYNSDVTLSNGEKAAAYSLKSTDPTDFPDQYYAFYIKNDKVSYAGADTLELLVAEDAGNFVIDAMTRK